MASARYFFKHQALRDAAYVPYMYSALIYSSFDSRILAWVPVGVFFTRHVYSLATVTGGSMQVSSICRSMNHNQ